MGWEQKFLSLQEGGSELQLENQERRDVRVGLTEERTERREEEGCTDPRWPSSRSSLERRWNVEICREPERPGTSEGGKRDADQTDPSGSLCSCLEVQLHQKERLSRWPE